MTEVEYRYIILLYYSNVNIITLIHFNKCLVCGPDKIRPRGRHLLTLVVVDDWKLILYNTIVYNSKLLTTMIGMTSIFIPYGT